MQPLSFSRVPRRVGWLVAALALFASLGACSSMKRIDTVVRPYRAELVQGNFVSKEQAAALQPGMSRLQVRDVLGTPLLTSLFHADRWDYVFTLRRQGEEAREFRLTVFFKNDALDRFEGDDLPSETEFIAKLYPNKDTPAKLPALEATPEQLAKYPAPAASQAPAQGAAPAAPPARADYPPLEAPAR